MARDADPSSWKWICIKISNLSFCPFSLHLSILSTEKRSLQHSIHTLTVPKNQSVSPNFLIHEEVKGSKLRKMKTFPPAYLNCVTLIFDLQKREISQNSYSPSSLCCKYAKLFRHQHQTWIGTHALTFPLYWFLSKVEKCQLSWLPNSLFLCFFLDKHEKVDGQGHSIAGLTVSQRNYLSSHKQPRRADNSSRFDTIFGLHNPPIFIQFYLNLQRVFNIDYTTLTEILFAQPARTV